MAQVASYHAAWRQYFTPLIFQKVSLTSVEDTPRFIFAEEPAGEVARRVLLAVVGLALPALVLGGIGLARLRRYPIV